MRIVEPDQSRTVLVMEGERIAQAVRPRLRHFRPLDLELDPVTARWIDEEDFAVEAKQRIKARIRVDGHSALVIIY